MTISQKIKDAAPVILAEIKKAKSILLHCHPSPDPDSVGSALAMKFALEGMGKKVAVIRGDSDIPEAFLHFPGAAEIIPKNFFEIDRAAYDLFIVQDSGSMDMISKRGEVKFPDNMSVVVIDHHRTNSGFGKINLIDPSYPATAQVLYDLFSEWQIEITPAIAANIFIGLYTDTGGFKYEGTSIRTFLIAAELVKIAPDFPKLISVMENTNTPEFLKFQGKALGSIDEYLGGKLAVSSVPYEFLKDNNIPTARDASAGSVSAILRTVRNWDIVAAAIQVEPERVKVSFRSRDADKYDVSKIAAELGGGGHKAAAGANLAMSLEEAKKLLVTKIQEIYNLHL